MRRMLCLPAQRALRVLAAPFHNLKTSSRRAESIFVTTLVPEKKYIVESMGGGVILIDYDRDGWPDIFFTNNPSVEQQLKNETAAGALYHNNHDGTFKNVTAKSGLSVACFGMGGAVGDLQQ